MVTLAFKKDEIHVKELSRRTKVIVALLCFAALLLLVYLTVYAYNNVSPFIALLLMVVLLIVAAVAIFALDIALYREIS